MDQQTDKRRRQGWRLLAILGLSVLATAAISFGGLALWTVTTQNNSNSFATGAVHHSNAANLNGALVTPTTCTDQTSPGACGAIFQITNAGPGSSISGTVKITNTGTRNSTFTLGPNTGANALTPAPGTSLICQHLLLTVTDAQATPATIYNGTLSAFATTANLLTSTGTATWAPSATNTYTFTVTLPSTDTDVNDMSASCAGGFLWSQTG